MFEIRKVVTVQETIFREQDIELKQPLHKVAVAAVVKNPGAGKYIEDLQLFIDKGGELGIYLTGIAKEVLGRENIESFGKGAIVGAEGEIEHGAAMNHVKFGNAMRQSLGYPCKTIVPSTVVRGGPGTPLCVPLVHREANLVRSHFDAVEVRLSDAPHADELVIIAAFADNGRPLSRLGGLKKEDIVGDGIR